MSDAGKERSALPVAPNLTRQPGPAGERAVLGDYLAFELGDRRYALPISSLREIMKPPPVTEVPRADPGVLGIISVRGRVTTLFDARRLLRLPAGEPSPRTRVLLADTGREVLGLLVDRVLQVYRFHEDEVEPASVLGGEVPVYVTGIGRPGTVLPAAGEGEAETEDARLHPVMGERVVNRPRAPAGGEVFVLLDPAALLGD